MLKNKKGFSLVELIVVIAIMAVLVGVLAPQLMKYVEKSRMQKDESAAAEYVAAVEKALSDETAYSDVMAGLTDNKFTITFDAGKLSADKISLDTLKAEVADVVKDVDFTSKAYKTVAFVITIDATGTAVKVYGDLGDKAIAH